MIAVDDADAVLARFAAEARRTVESDPALTQLAGMLPPQGKDIGIAELIPIATVILTTPVLKGAERQLAVLDAVGHAWARARGLHIAEE